jgi:5S rRNA maturation endonuclease (ribonuclease M5)
MRLRVKKKMWTVSEKIAAEDCGKEYPKGRFAKRTQVGYWFGLHLMDWDKPVVLVEGEDDAMRLWDLGKPNSMASGGTAVTKRQLSEILSLQIILGTDHDKGGNEALKRLKFLLAERAVLYYVDWSKARRSDGKGGLKPCKDSRDLPDEDALIKVFSNIKRLS